MTSRSARTLALLLAVGATSASVVFARAPVPASGPSRAALLSADAHAPRADLTIHGWRIAPPTAIARETPSLRACEPRWTRRPGDLDPFGGSLRRTACGRLPMSASVSWRTAGGEVEVVRARWDRPAFPIDAAAGRVRATRIVDRPSIVFDPVAPGAGIAEILVIEDGIFDPYAVVLHVIGADVPMPYLYAVAEAAVLGASSPQVPPIPLLEPRPPSTVSFELRMFPPAARAGGRAKLTSDWHCSRVSGDDCPAARARSCSPGAYGHSSCTALDWNDGVPTRGESVWFRTHGSSDAATPAVRAEPGSYTATCQVLRVSIVDAGTPVAALRFQHVSRARGPFDVAISPKGARTDVRIGSMVDERRLNPGCPWTGFHVHEDDTTSPAWSAWNTKRFRSAEGKRFAPDAARNWTRILRWQREEA